MRWASRKLSTASSYWKLWRAATPRRKAGWAGSEPEFGNRMGEETTSTASASAPTAAMLARGCRLPSVSGDAGATRRRFLEASAGAAAASWLSSVGAAGPPGGPGPDGGGELLGTLPFVGEGTFPVEAT